MYFHDFFSLPYFLNENMQALRVLLLFTFRINKRLTRASFSNFAIFGLSKLENLEEKVESMSHEVVRFIFFKIISLHVHPYLIV